MKLAFPDDRIVAGSRTWRDFRRAVAATAANPGTVLLEEDGYRFIVGLFGLLAAGKTAILPANSQPGTLAALDEHPIVIAEEGEALWDGEIDADAARLDFFTSGSTGIPKRISRSLSELADEIDVLEQRWALGSAPVHALVSHQHIFGLTFRLLWPLFKGRPFARFSDDLWPEGAVLIVSPAHLSRLGGLIARDRLTAIFTAGAPLPAEAARQAEALFGQLPNEIYGSTETGAIATRQAGQDWMPFPGNEIAFAEDGRLLLRAPYAGGGDWIETQDRAEPSGNGFRLLGRIDRIAKIAGKRIDLDEVEAALKKMKDVADAAILTLEGDEAVLAAVIVLSEAGQRELAELGAFRLSRRLRAALAETQESAGRPRRWRFVEALPRGGLDKPSRPAMQALFAEAPREPIVLAEHAEGFEIEIPPDLVWLDGHFPEAPVLPGVVQLDWALSFARRRFGLTQMAAREFQVKFKSVIQPGERLLLRLTHDPAARRLKFAYERDGAACSTGSIVLDETP